MGGHDELLVCPYNKAHYIVPHRMPYHLEKCRKQYKGPPMSICPFNASHRFIEADRQEHYTECIDYIRNFPAQSHR